MFRVVPLSVLFIVPLVLGRPNADPVNAQGVTAVDGNKLRGSSIPNIEKTIAEVEELIRNNPTYPKLTRGEIIDLVENITRAEALIKANKTRDDGKRAIMVVMPFTPGSSKEISDLYTKPPVTHIIGDGAAESKHSKPRKPSYSTKTSVSVQTSSGKPFAEVETLPITQLFPNIKDVSETIQNDPMKELKETTTVKSRRRKPPTTTTTEQPKVTQRRNQVRRRTTPQHPNHKYPIEDLKKEEFSSSEGMRIVSAPNLANEPNIFEEEPSTTRKPAIRRRTTTIYKPQTFEVPSVTAKPSFEHINLPNDLKAVMEDLNLPQPEEPPVANFKPEQQDMENILASVGIYQTSTTTTSLPDVSNVADNLSPEMRELLMSFGLIPNPNEKKSTKKPNSMEPLKADTSAQSYVGFKPLPDSAPSRDDMETFLNTFGLGRNGRQQKPKSEENPEDGFNFDMVPGSLKNVLTDIGLKEKQPKKIRTQEGEKTVEKQHIFNPNDSQYATEEELNKLSKLLDVVKQLEKLNGTATEEDLKKIDLNGLKDLVGSLNHVNVPLNEQSPGPDPLNYDSSAEKNEVKRQQENSSSTISGSVSVSASVETTDVNIEESSSKPDIKHLEESFGGAPVETTTSGPSPPRSGFYYLVDWNTFLDIDDQKGRRVNLRFQPTVGDPKRFLSVSVP